MNNKHSKLLKRININIELSNKTSSGFVTDIGLITKSNLTLFSLTNVKLKNQLFFSYLTGKKKSVVSRKIRANEHNFKHLKNKGKLVGFCHAIW